MTSVISSEITRPDYRRKVSLDNGKIFYVSPIDDFKPGDRVEIFANKYGCGFDEMVIEGIRKVA